MSSSRMLRLFFNVTVFILYLCVICTPYLQSVGAEDSQAEESFVDSAKILGKLVDDVSEMKHGIQLLEKAVLGKEYSKDVDHGNDVSEQNEPSNVRIIVSYPSDDVTECRVEHEWRDISQLFWAVDGVMVPETKYEQARGSDFFSITVPSAILSEFRDDRFMEKEFMFGVLVKGLTYMVGFQIPQSNISINKTEAPRVQRKSLTDEINLYTFTVSPSRTKNIEYTPGEHLEFRIHPHSIGNDSDFSCSLTGVNDNQDDTQAVVYDNYGNTDNINITKEMTSDSWTIKVTINTELLLVGGILSLVGWTKRPAVSEVALKNVFVTSIQVVYLHRSNTNSPIPRDRVAIAYKEIYENQTLSLLSPESPVTCVAIGNPTPKIEFRVEGHHLEWEQASWITPYQSYSTVLAPKGTPYHQITCHAESGEAVAELSINMEYSLIFDKDMSNFRRISDKLIEATCVITGRPAPDIYFYVDYESPENILSADDDHVTIISSTDKDTTTSTLLYDTSDRDDLWSVNCVGSSNGQRREHYFYMSEYQLNL